ncbi:trichohyalin-like isoform X1 [Octopus vulgaris]|uniref:Trichohyalin-like isoform X1 n=2 Tax=Octopus TaxID=6643 RepID=A0AA36FML9_OCTVU|nr:centrosomal protein of 131 kDa isoform X1 [Octopus sinensis]CAI9739358.1 trichohyalin-like isoform X1 [Octopus vulgaris]
MSAVCKWISGFCIWENHKKIQHQVHPDQQPFDALIIWREKAKESTGGVAYEVILKPASNYTPHKPGSPPKETRSLTQEAIADKLKKAQERRESLETQRLEQLQKERERAQQVLQKAQEENNTFSKSTKEKLRRSLELNKENREAQIKALQDRLREHRKKVSDACKNSEMVSKDLEEKINQKFEKYDQNRRAQMQLLLDRLREHDKHIKEVNNACETMYKTSGEKIGEKVFQKMDSAIKNREGVIKAIQDRLQEHEKRIEEVRKNKLSVHEDDDSYECVVDNS